MRELLEQRIGQVTDEEFGRILDMTTSDIRYNRIEFLEKTTLEDVLNIAEISLNILRRRMN